MCCSGVFVYLLAVRLSFLKSPTFFIAAPVILIVCLLEIAHFPRLNRYEWIFFDERVRLAHNVRNAVSDIATNIGLVEITDRTIYEVQYVPHLGFDYGLYWPRDVYAADVPYVVALIALDEGVRIPSNIVGIAPEEVRADMPVRVVFREATPEITLPLFEPA